MKPKYNKDSKFYQFSDQPDFKPVYSPIEMIKLGVFGGNYFGNTEVNKNFKDFVPQEFLKDCKSILPGRYLRPEYKSSVNKYGVKCGMDYAGWMKSGWIHEQDPYGWFNWFINFYYGRRSLDDERQIKRWRSFISRHSAQLISQCIKKNKSIDDLSLGKKTRQGLLHWSYEIK